MKIRISERHIKLRPAVRQSIIEKLESLERYFDRTISIDAVVEEEKGHHSVRLMAHLARKKIVKAETEQQDLHLAINAAVDNLKGQLIRYKEQLTDHRSKAEGPPEPEVKVSAASRLSALEHTEIHLRKPMTVEEALLQLEAYNRNLFLFDDAEGGGLRILHRHPDGHVELLEPKY